MISIYQVFKIIFGLVISSFILFIIINFVTIYIGLQEDSQRAEIIHNFLKTSGDVYFTGNPISFDDFSRQDFTMTFDISQPEGIVSQTGKTPVFTPLFFDPGDEVFIYRGEMDMGWWKFRFIEAMPQTLVVFNPISQDNGLTEGIVNLLPDTEFLEPKVTFGFCNGQALEEKGEKQFFLAFLPLEPMVRCTATLPPDAKLITIDPSCLSVTRGFCLTPPDSQGIGNLFIKGQLVGFYKDPLDIVSSVIGGEEEDVYGNSGLTLYQYKNHVFRREIALAASIMASRAFLIQREYNSLGLDSCLQAFGDFQRTMESISAFFEDNGDYYNNAGEVASLASLLEQARSGHEDLVNKGCDYR